MHFAKSKLSLSLPEDSPAGRAVENDVFKLFFDFLSKNGVSFYDSESELLKISRPIDEINAINLPVVGFVFGY